ncbi:tetratricopeptide repeat protein [Sphingomonas humi]|uniref:Tetratricopeptide repeat protein n=1 Tax=Sphingomonas humi TaxID=335630 RepID=A0ABP7SC07_9SPHN
MDFLRSSASTFVAARAAASAGDPRRAAILYASLASDPEANRFVGERALGQAILAGDMPLALRLARAQPGETLGVDARMLLAADALRSGKGAALVERGLPTELRFLEPFLKAWTLAERGRWRDGVAVLDAIGRDNMLAGLAPEHKALILLAAGRTSEAKPLLEPAIAAARGRSNRLRIAFAAGLAAKGERDAGMALLGGRDVTLHNAAASLAAERRPRPLITTAAQGLSELLTALVLNLDEDEEPALPLALTQVARFADPANEQAVLLLGVLLERSGRFDDAIMLQRTLAERSPFIDEARDGEIRTLLAAGRKDEALARAKAFVAEDGQQPSDWLRLGDVLDAMKRHEEAAVAYGGAVQVMAAGAAGPEPWTVHLLRGAALEQAGKWPQAESALELAYRMAPENPTVLNYLGYARLERGEKLAEAEAMIAEASRRAPNDASITDSLGWAQFKRGKVTEAIATLQRAAAAEPGLSEIHEHLGDALYTAGRKYEARFAWAAALVSAEDDVSARVSAKIGAGLTPATAAP